jgi:hypothetical protein
MRPVCPSFGSDHGHQKPPLRRAEGVALPRHDPRDEQTLRFQVGRSSRGDPALADADFTAEILEAEVVVKHTADGHIFAFRY